MSLAEQMMEEMIIKREIAYSMTEDKQWCREWNIAGEVKIFECDEKGKPLCST